jgi:hypothetical protein
MCIRRLASNEIFSSSNKVHREVGRAKDLTAPWYCMCMRTWFWWGNVKGIDHLGDPDIDGRVVLSGFSRTRRGGHDCIVLAEDGDKERFFENAVRNARLP